jgi:ferritin-like metal-binding protein YciE
MTESAEQSQSEEEDEQEQEEETEEERAQATSYENKDTDELLLDHLMDVHALEEQGSKQLEGAIDLTEGTDLEKLFKDHLDKAREHEELVRKRIEARETKPSAIKDLTMQAASGVGLRYLDDHPADTPVKLIMHMFCLASAEIAAYEFLQRFAQAAGDDETAQAAEKILEDEQEMLEKLQGGFDQAVELLGEYRGKDDDEEDNEDDEDDDDSEDSEKDEDDED